MLELSDLAIILVTLAAASLIADRLRLSAIPVYILAGIVLGPSPGFPEVIAPSEGTELLSRIGVALLLFFLGLEFSPTRLAGSGRKFAVGGGVDLVVNAGLGLGVGLFLFGPGAEAVLVAGLVYISSSGIIARALTDLRRLGDDETDLVLGVLVVEDVAIAVFLGVAAALASGDAVSPSTVAGTGLLALVFVLLFLLAGRFAHHAIDRAAPRLDGEQLLLGGLALALGAAALAEVAGLSEAVGALLAGILLSGTQARDAIEERLLAVRDFAAAIFFFSFGLAIDLGEAGPVVPWLALAVPIGVAGKAVGGFVAGRATGHTPRQSLNVGAALVARGEFTLILAQLAAAGVALDAQFREGVAAFAGLFVLASAIIGVLFMRESRRIGRWLFRRRTPARTLSRGDDGRRP